MNPKVKKIANLKAMKTRQSKNTKPPISRTRKHNVKNKKVNPMQQSLVRFIEEKSVTSSVSSTPSAPNSLLNLFPEHAKEGYIYVLVLGIDKDLRDIKPMLLLVKRDENVEKQENGDSVYIRFRESHICYIGKIVMSSENRIALEKSLASVNEMVAKTAAKSVYKCEKLISSITKPVVTFKPEKTDTRFLYLNSLLGCELDEQKSQEISGNELNNHEQEKKSNPFSDIDDEFLMNELTQESSASHEHDKPEEYTITSDEAETENIHGAREKVKTRRVHNFSDPILVAKLREERTKLDMNLEMEISRAMDKLNDIIPTLDVTNQLTPVVKNIYNLCVAMNKKLNNTNEAKSKDFGIPLDEKINVSKIIETNQLNISGKIFLPLKDWDKVIKATKPSLVVSRIVRMCIPSELKLNCEINDRPNKSNFIYRFGSDKLEGDQRMKDGQEKLDILIRYAHQIQYMDTMSLQSYRESMGQIQKALYDFNRTRTEKKRVQELDKDEVQAIEQPQSDEPMNAISIY
ncbi:uncharacterized protein LOC128389784 [Panonychus citri]|uniref:uncharacterized protein LOC128389784 n=1 Tax=Panonychus citri TaxID=50023 RepID=UPI0023074E2A|nr:uncharacterized protein LOC128389784 [Panonychus citri]